MIVASLAFLEARPSANDVAAPQIGIRVGSIPRIWFNDNPAGAFYIFPKVEAIEKWKGDAEFVTDLLNETGVVVVHGSGFDPIYGKDHFRIVFLPQENVLNEAYDKIESFMKKHS
jgi:aspartate/methionine/tyrosine aminotransferase